MITRGIAYPEPGSNRHGSESTGVWDQRVYQFRHLGVLASAKIDYFLISAKYFSAFSELNLQPLFVALLLYFCSLFGSRCVARGSL